MTLDDRRLSVTQLIEILHKSADLALRTAWIHVAGESTLPFIGDDTWPKCVVTGWVGDITLPKAMYLEMKAVLGLMVEKGIGEDYFRPIQLSVPKLTLSSTGAPANDDSDKLDLADTQTQRTQVQPSPPEQTQLN